jgi:hypothetical protein
MGFLRKMFSSGVDAPPSVVGWTRLPTLTVAVVGSLKKTPDLESIRAVYMKLVSRVFPATEQDLAKNRFAIDKYYSELVAENLDFKEIPNVSDTGHSDILSRLFSVGIKGMVWLLVDEGATINETDASLVPAVVSEFIRDSRCVTVQGRGHHLFVSSELVRSLSFSGGDSLSRKAKAHGLVSKRVGYISIDRRTEAAFEL